MRWAISRRNKVYAWTPDDYKVSEAMQAYFANFVKTGDPNGPGLPKWPAATGGGDSQVMRIDVTPGAALETASRPLRAPGFDLHVVAEVRP